MLEVRDARMSAGLSHVDSARMVGLGNGQRWTEYEAGIRQMDPARWELYLLKTGQHPSFVMRHRADSAAGWPTYPKVAFFEAFAEDAGSIEVKFAACAVDEPLIEKLQRMHTVCIERNLSELRYRAAPDRWGPGDAARALRLGRPEIVVTTTGFSFTDQSLASSCRVTTREVDIGRLLDRVRSVGASELLVFGSASRVDGLKDRILSELDECVERQAA